ncbi:hypothetical protein DFJ77DRAFT_472647 [Powellomyces hirtus]|nr:hypothetical protein DFJ77DRAFT_472647 [Powellomyces hirtus]
MAIATTQAPAVHTRDSNAIRPSLPPNPVMVQREVDRVNQDQQRPEQSARNRDGITKRAENKRALDLQPSGPPPEGPTHQRRNDLNRSGFGRERDPIGPIHRPIRRDSFPSSSRIEEPFPNQGGPFRRDIPMPRGDRGNRHMTDDTRSDVRLREPPIERDRLGNAPSRRGPPVGDGYLQPPPRRSAGGPSSMDGRRRADDRPSLPLLPPPGEGPPSQRQDSFVPQRHQDERMHDETHRVNGRPGPGAQQGRMLMAPEGLPRGPPDSRPNEMQGSERCVTESIRLCQRNLI